MRAGISAPPSSLLQAVAGSLMLGMGRGAERLNGSEQMCRIAVQKVYVDCRALAA